MPIAKQPQPYKSTMVVGILASMTLAALAIIILMQLLYFPQNQLGLFLAVINDARILKTVIFTVFQAALSTIFSIIIGIILAWSLANQRQFPFRGGLIALISSALVLPTLVVVLGIISVYGRNGWLADLSKATLDQPLPFSIYGLLGILLAHIFLNASFAARILLHRFEAIPDEKHKLCHALGMGIWQRIKFVELPAIIGTLPGLAVTIFLLCFTSFAIVLTLGGSPSYNTLEVSIYEAIKFDFDLYRAFQLALVQIAICMALVLLSSFSPDSLAQASTRQKLPRYAHLTSSPERISQFVIIILFALFFVSPLIAVSIDGIGPQLVKLFKDPTFHSALFTSLIIALSSTLLALVFSFAIASAIVTLSSPGRMLQSRFARSKLGKSIITRFLLPFLTLTTMLYLVFPALVMGFGFFMLFQRFGGNATGWAIGVVIIANALIAIPFAIATLRPAIFAAANRYDRLCAALGLGRWLRWKVIDWPMLKSDLSYVAAIAFCFSLGDLGVIALFGSDEFKTLPWLLYQNIGSYRTQQASAIAWVLLMLVVMVFWLAQAPPKREHPV